MLVARASATSPNPASFNRRLRIGHDGNAAIGDGRLDGGTDLLDDNPLFTLQLLRIEGGIGQNV